MRPSIEGRASLGFMEAHHRASQDSLSGLPQPGDEALAGGWLRPRTLSGHSLGEFGRVFAMTSLVCSHTHSIQISRHTESIESPDEEEAEDQDEEEGELSQLDMDGDISEGMCL